MATTSFRDLEVWREAMTLAEEVYALSRLFPADERLNLPAGSVTARYPRRFANGLLGLVEC